MTATTNEVVPAAGRATADDVIPPRATTGRAPGTEGTVAGRTLRYALLIGFLVMIFIPPSFSSWLRR